MDTIGIICEYNPFHNGHIYHIKKIKELYPNSIIILVMSGNFTQRGDISLINKWDKTKIALENNIDLVIELPFVFATQGADIFAKGAIQILNNLKVDKLIFGSESNDIEQLTKCAKIQLDEKYDKKVIEYINKGINYPTATSQVLKELGGINIDNPNDILGLCYIKEIIKQKSNIEPITIKRTNNYHSKELKEISSATAIRQALKENKNINKYIPKETIKYINKKRFIENYYQYLKYKIITEENIEKYETIDDKIKYRIKKYIYESNTLEELIEKVKTKRYTYNRIKRMFLHILCNFTKEENEKCKDIHYIRILGFNEQGKKYLNKIKKQIKIPIISNFGSLKDIMLDIELRTTCIYSSIFEDQNEIIKSEYQNKPIIK
jgi:predicted nucleotidyltransferase